MATYSFANLLLACKKKPQFPWNAAFRRIHSSSQWWRSTEFSSTSEMRVLLQNYIDGSVMSPSDKHSVRQELRRNNMTTSPSDAALLLYTRIYGYDTILEPVLKQLEGHIDHLWDEKSTNSVTGALNSADEDAGRRRDLTGMETITIDDEKTTDIDDGLSASLVDTGTVCVSIHIADPTRWLSDPSSPLAMQARHRGRTLYLPHTKFSMLPPSLGADVCSLREGSETAALTMSCLIRTGDGSIIDNSIDITPSTVESDKKLSYDIVDAYLEEKSSERGDTDVIHLLNLVAESRARRRQYDGGAITLSPSNEISFNASLSPYYIDISSKSIGTSKARSLVSEMMILAGEIFGQVGREFDTPLPYRGQQVPVIPTTEDLFDYPKGPCRNFYLRKFMLKSIVDARVPQRHQSLGLEQYVQSTSPIRRYMDMLAHWQMKSILRGGNPIYTPDELQEIIDNVTRVDTMLTSVERKIQDTWLCAYFLDHQNIELEAIVLHWVNQEHSLAIVYVSSVGKEVVATIHHPVALGGNVLVYCTHADPLTRSLSFSTQMRA